MYRINSSSEIDYLSAMRELAKIFILRVYSSINLVHFFVVSSKRCNWRTLAFDLVENSCSRTVHTSADDLQWTT